MAEYKVGDNWWHSKDYYNIPLDDFMSVLKNAIRNGYSIGIGGDVSEAGLSRETQCALDSILSIFLRPILMMMHGSSGSPITVQLTIMECILLDILRKMGKTGFLLRIPDQVLKMATRKPRNLDIIFSMKITLSSR